MTFSQEQHERNQQSREKWEVYASHRARVTYLLQQAIASPAPNKLLVLGAGNCNDLDLKTLLETFSQIDLVDIDTGALAAGVDRQLQDDDKASVQILPATDLTGLFEDFARWADSETTANDEVANALERAKSYQLPWQCQYDVVASVCTLSQLMEPVAKALGPEHPQFVATLQTIRTQHLRQMIECLKPGGRACLVADIVSSETCEELKSCPENQLLDLVKQCIGKGDFFHGMNPINLLRQLHLHQPPLELVADLQQYYPWIWDFGPRLYLVCPYTFRRGNG